MSRYYVYIMTNRTGTLYIGVTNDLRRRTYQHREGQGSSFTRRYNLGRLIYYEQTDDVRVALEREKQLKGWRREKKIALIARENPTFCDLSADWS
ncbi:MAG: GIY-YIG nuclease family protein [Candidatus Brocadiia bacterium]